MNEEEYQQRIADERLLGRVVVSHYVNTQLAMPLGVYLHNGEIHPLPSDRQLLSRRLRNKSTPPYALDDCVNWKTNVLGDCGGRVEMVNGQVVCETCRNHRAEPLDDQGNLIGNKYRRI